MIYGVTGSLGGGKSYGCVQKGLLHIKKRGVWATNIVVNIPLAAEWCGVSEDVFKSRYYCIDPDENGNCWDWPRGDSRGKGTRRVLITIDEAGEWFSNLSADSKKAVSDFASWLRQSDKRGQDVHLIIQDASILAKQGRVLAHRWLKMRNMKQWKIPKLGWPLPPPWCNEFHELEFDQTGRNFQGKTIYMRDKRIYKIYDTSSMFGASAKSSEGVFAYDNALEEKPKEISLLRVFVWSGCAFWIVMFLGMVFL